MELTDLIVQLNREAAKKTPDVYKKVMSKARSEGLVKSKKTNAQQNRSYDKYDYDYDYDYDYGNRNYGSGKHSSGIGKRILSWIIWLIFIALSITLVTYTIKIVVYKEVEDPNATQPAGLISPINQEDTSEPEGYVLNVDES